MILTDAEYQRAIEQFRAAKKHLEAEQVRLKEEGLTKAEIKRLLEPARSFYLQFQEEAAAYRRLKRGDFGELTNFHAVGKFLIAIRIYLGLTQRELAKRLGTHESQVSRDERNDYHGITLGRLEHTLEIMGVSLTFTPKIRKPRAA